MRREAKPCPFYGMPCEYVPMAEKAQDRIEKLEAALRECEAELDAYYRNEYGGIHPYNQKKLEQAMATNPARAALENVHSIGHEDGLCPRERT